MAALIPDYDFYEACINMLVVDSVWCKVGLWNVKLLTR
jgi:hypothetical protein